MNYIFRDCTRSADRMQQQQQQSPVLVLYQPTSSAKTANCGSGTRVAMPRTTNLFFSLLLTKRTSFSFSPCNIRLAKRGPVGEGKRRTKTQLYIIVGAVTSKRCAGNFFHHLWWSGILASLYQNTDRPTPKAVVLVRTVQTVNHISRTYL